LRPVCYAVPWARLGICGSAGVLCCLLRLCINVYTPAVSHETGFVSECWAVFGIFTFNISNTLELWVFDNDVWICFCYPLHWTRLLYPFPLSTTFSRVYWSTHVFT